MSLVRIVIIALVTYLSLSGLLTWSVLQTIELPDPIQQFVLGAQDGD